MSTADRKTARAQLAEVTERLWEEQKGECLDVLVEEFGEWLRQFCTPPSPPPPESKQGGSSEGLPTVDLRADGSALLRRPQTLEDNEEHPRSFGSKDQDIKRTLLWSHHLLATSKRKDVLTWSRELHLGGYSRPGYPGAIFVEGESASVDEFVRRIKGLRWQALQVRAEEDGESRVCGNGAEGVLEVESLGEVVQGLKRKDENVAKMFLEGMRIAH